MSVPSINQLLSGGIGQDALPVEVTGYLVGLYDVLRELGDLVRLVP